MSADHLDTSAVQRTPPPASSEPGGSTDGPGRPAPRFDVSRIVVVVFIALFAIGAVGFLSRVLDTVDEQPSPTPAVTAEPAGAVITVPRTPTPLVDQDTPSIPPSVVTSPPPSVAPTEVPGGSPCPSPLPTMSASITPDVSILPEAPGPGTTDQPGMPPADPSAAPTTLPADPCPPQVAELVRRAMPFVPVVRFWETRQSIGRDALVAALRGRATDYRRVFIPSGDRAALEDALGITIDASVREADPAAIIAAVKKGRTLGILRASDVVPGVRALGIDGRQLFGNERVQRLGRWPLVAEVETTRAAGWRQDDTWTLVAGGDSFTDRGIYERVVRRNKGLDYPFDGGRARVTGHHICPSCPRAEGNLVPIYRLSGPKGLVRALVKDADLAIVNHEQPTPRNWVFHLFGTTFSGKPSLTEIFTRAGVDFMSLANNHIRDYGEAGVLNTLKVLDQHGIKHAGAGKNAKEAAKPAYLTAKGVTVGIVACNMIARGYVNARGSRAGAADCKARETIDAIKRARERADVLIVFPHWGIEFSRGRAAYQDALARRWEKLGVDLVFGAHAHVPGGIGEVNGMPVFYSLGNFIFDQSWSTATMEGILVEATFHGDRLVQTRVHPFLTHDQAQPNLLDPARDDGRVLMNEIRKQSKRVSDW
ncbi:MAG: CapA family protein [Chloroflexi bacterium]|nr:CapA family protein [Chloroflexota bacterium]